MTDGGLLRPITKASSKVLMVLGGYLAALGIAAVVLRLYVGATEGPDRQTYGGMFAFGDDLLFVGVAALAAIPASGAALFFLRPYPRFWRLSASAALAVAATGVAALVSVLAPQSLATSSWAMAAPLRVLLAPVLAMAFFLGALFAPIRFARVAFLTAVAIETVVFVWVALVWSHPVR
jgi:hypothetical protein